VRKLGLAAEAGHEAGHAHRHVLAGALLVVQRAAGVTLCAVPEVSFRRPPP
jgi:hypothetical protein